MTRKRAFPWGRILDRLSAYYGRGDWRVPYLRNHAEDPFQVLIGTILSQRTRDEATDIASARLFARYPTPRALAAAPREQVEQLIRPTGFYRTKSKVVRECARAILNQWDGEVPRTMEELVALPGVGPKTANCVLVFGYGIPAIPVDTHVHRIANRLGVVRTRTPEETERELRKRIDRRFWVPLNPLLVQHSQNVCRPIGPKCEICPIALWCATGRARAAGRPPPRPEDARRARRGAPSASLGRTSARPRGRPPRARAPSTRPGSPPRRPPPRTPMR